MPPNQRRLGILVRSADVPQQLKKVDVFPRVWRNAVVRQARPGGSIKLVERHTIAEFGEAIEPVAKPWAGFYRDVLISQRQELAPESACKDRNLSNIVLFAEKEEPCFGGLRSKPIGRGTGEPSLGTLDLERVRLQLRADSLLDAYRRSQA